MHEFYDMTGPLFIKGKRFFDKRKLIVQPTDGDGGDSCQRMGFYHAGLVMRAKKEPMIIHKYPYSRKEHYEYALIQLQHSSKKGIYCRHPDPEKWYSDFDRLSRDQATPMVIAMGLYGMKKRLFWFLLKHILRLGFFTNTKRNGIYKNEDEHTRKAPGWLKWDYSWKLPDIAGPEFWGFYIRGFRLFPLYPLLFVCDLGTLIGSLIRRFNDDVDVLNHVCASVYAQHIMPTPISWLVSKVNSADELSWKMKTYFRRSKGPSGFATLYKELLK